MGGVALIFILFYWTVILIPAVGTCWIGRSLINRLGRWPSKTPAIQMSILFKLVVLEVVSFTLLLAFFKALVAVD